jgi:hypothetical protein
MKNRFDPGLTTQSEILAYLAGITAEKDFIKF